MKESSKVIKSPYCDEQVRLCTKKLIENLNHALSNKIAFPVIDGIEYVNTEDIIRIEADGSYSKIFLYDGIKLTTSKSIKKIEEQLKEQSFFRTHKSHIINLKYIKKYNMKKDPEIRMTDGSIVHVSRYKKDDFLKLISKFIN